MKLFYYKGETDNFGDDLNPWLWSKIASDIIDDDPSELFVVLVRFLVINYPNALLNMFLVRVSVMKNYLL